MTNPAFRESFWNPKVLSPRGILFLGAIFFIPILFVPIADQIQTVQTYSVANGVGYRTHPGVNVCVAVAGVMCLAAVLYFRRGLWWLLLIPVFISALVVLRVPNAGAVVTDQHYRWTNGWGEEITIELKNIDRIIINTNKEYGRYGVRKDVDVIFFYQDESYISVPYSKSGVSGQALDPVLIQLKAEGIDVNNQTTGSAR